MHRLDSPQNKNRVGMRTDGFDAKSRMGSQNSIVHEGASGRGPGRGELTYVHVHTSTEVGDVHTSLFFSILLSETRSLTHPGSDHVG